MTTEKGEAEAMKRVAGYSFNVLLKKMGEMWVAHCLELDIVATSDTPKQAVDDLAHLVAAQLQFALANDNMEYLFKPAPKEVFAEFLQCREGLESSFSIEKEASLGDVGWKSFIANICSPQSDCVAQTV